MGGGDKRDVGKMIQWSRYVSGTFWFSEEQKPQDRVGNLTVLLGTDLDENTD